jgi:hypothetical protein
MQVRHTIAGQRLTTRREKPTRQVGEEAETVARRRRGRGLPTVIFTAVLVVTGAVVSVTAGILAGVPIREWPPIASRPTQALIILVAAVLYGFAGSRLIARWRSSRASNRRD